MNRARIKAIKSKAVDRLEKTVLPCPCCGEARLLNSASTETELAGLYVGTDSNDSQCVQCYSCGLRMIKGQVADRFPQRKGESDDAWMARWELDALKRAVKAWNRRTNDG